MLDGMPWQKTGAMKDRGKFALEWEDSLWIARYRAAGHDILRCRSARDRRTAIHARSQTRASSGRAGCRAVAASASCR
jgi:hypothetical protein